MFIGEKYIKDSNKTGEVYSERIHISESPFTALWCGKSLCLRLITAPYSKLARPRTFYVIASLFFFSFLPKLNNIENNQSYVHYFLAYPRI